MPSVLPSREKEWQFAQVAYPSQQAAARLGDVAQNARQAAAGLAWPKAESTGLRFRGDQWHVTVEDWRPTGSFEVLIVTCRERVAALHRALKSGDGDGSCMFPGVQLDGSQVAASVSRCVPGLQGCQLGQFVTRRDATRVDLADAQPLARGFRVNCSRTVAELHIDGP